MKALFLVLLVSAVSYAGQTPNRGSGYFYGVNKDTYVVKEPVMISDAEFACAEKCSTSKKEACYEKCVAKEKARDAGIDALNDEYRRMERYQ